MDSVPDTGLYSDIITDPSATDPTFTADTSIPSIPSVLGDLGTWAGLDPNHFGFVTDAATLLKSIIGAVGGMVSLGLISHPIDWVRHIGVYAGKLDTLIDISATEDAASSPTGVATVGGTASQVGAAAWQWIANHSIGSFFSGMLNIGLGVDTSKFDAEATRGVQTVDTMLGFTFLLQYIIAGADHLGKALLAGRWPESLHETLAKIPEEMGLSWALGLTIDEAFKTAVGRSIEEGINRQKRGERIGWPQLRTLLKQHVLDPADFQTLMENQGFPDEQIDLLRNLQDVQIPIGDIAQLWYREEIDDAEAKKLIGELGFGEKQVDWLYNLYVSKAENSASVTYRTIVRGMFVNHLVTEDMYRTVLQNANYPQKLIDEDVAGILLEQSVGHVLNAVTTIKTRYQHGAIDAQEARKELRELNYADTYITQLIQTWDMKPLVKSHGLSQAKILSYYVSGTLTRSQAEPQLLATGLDEPSTTFLLDHPTANGGVRMHQRTPGLVTQTYLDGALTLEQLPDAYKSAHVQDADIPWYVNNAKYRYAHMKGHSVPTKVLSDGDIRAAFKTGLIDFPHCVVMLQVNGWSSDDAMLLTEITNKGPYQAPGTPAFATLGDALLYLQQHGFNLTPPPDPMLMAAETMAGMAGWSWTVNPGAAPVGSVPPPVITPPVIVPPPLPGQ